jgi:magnesium chelatase family protein
LARRAEAERYGSNGRSRYNAHRFSRPIRICCPHDSAGMQFMKCAIHEMGLTARARHRILRVARTIANLDGSDSIQSHHLMESNNQCSVQPGSRGWHL